MEKIEISPRDFMGNDEKYLENRCRQWDERIWLEENNKKKTLEIYNGPRVNEISLYCQFQSTGAR